jgi:hypothetical protein
VRSATDAAADAAAGDDEVQGLCHSGSRIEARSDSIAAAASKPSAAVSYTSSRHGPLEVSDFLTFNRSHTCH